MINRSHSFGMQGALVTVFALAAAGLGSLTLKATDWTQIESVRDVLKRGYQYVKLDLAMISELAAPLLDTVLIALGGTLAAGLLTIGLLRPRHSATRPLVNSLAALGGAMHELIWGLLLVAAFGPGIVVGIAVLALCSIRPFANCLRNRQTSAQLAIETMLRVWVDNLGRAAVLGLVGVGGLGLHFYERFTSYQFGATAVTLLAVVALIAAGQLLLHSTGIRPVRLWPGSNASGLANERTRAVACGDGLSRWAGRSVLLLLVGTILITPLIRPSMPTVIELPADVGAFLLGLAQSAAETLQMSLVASVLGVSAAITLGVLGTIRIRLAGPLVRVAAAGVCLGSLAVPAIFLALLGRSVLTIGPLSGTIALTFAAIGIASRRLSHPETDARGRTYDLSSIVDVFIDILPVAMAVGVFASGGIGWHLRLSLISGQTLHIACSLVTMLVLVSLCRAGRRWLRRFLGDGSPSVQRDTQSTNETA